MTYGDAVAGSSRLGFRRVDLDDWLDARRDRFGILLALLATAFLITGEGDVRWTRVVAASLNLAALAAGFLSAGIRRDRPRLAALAGIGLTGTVLVAVLPLEKAGAAIGGLCQVLVLGAVLVAVLKRVMSHEEVALNTVLGAIAAYFLIGLIFAWAYVSIYGFVDGAVFDPAERGLPAYYSFVVLTTLGFGDIVPVNEFARRLSAIEAIVGQVFLATLVARLVSMYGRRPRGEPDSTE